METTLTISTTAVTTVPHAVNPNRRSDTRVPAVETISSTATLPTDAAFVAQVVTARLSGTAFPDNPAEIAPPERRLKPYDLPMLPSDKQDTENYATRGDDRPNATDSAGMREGHAARFKPPFATLTEA